jgi:prepilin-type N-terminal cleavage/methylation domain-containing protein
MKSLNRGFSLMELMIAVAILLVAILGLLAAFINCILLNESNNNLGVAASDAQYVLEQIKGLAYSGIATYTAPAFTNLTGETITLTRLILARPKGDLTEVTVKVSWTERQRNRDVSVSTRIAP